MSASEFWDGGPLDPVRDREVLRTRYTILSGAVRLPGDGSVRLVRRAGWVAVPTELPDAQDALPLLVLCEQEQRTVLSGMSLRQQGWTDDQGRPVWPLGFDVPATLDGLQAFLGTVSAFVNCYALLPDDLAWVVVIMGPSEYAVLLGPSKTIETIIERPVEQGYALFEEYARSEEAGREHRIGVLTALRDRYPRLAPGETLSLDASWATWKPPTPDGASQP